MNAWPTMVVRWLFCHISYRWPTLYVTKCSLSKGVLRMQMARALRFLLLQSGYSCYVSCGYVHFGMGASLTMVVWRLLCRDLYRRLALRASVCPLSKSALRVHAARLLRFLCDNLAIVATSYAAMFFSALAHRSQWLSGGCYVMIYIAGWRFALPFARSRKALFSFMRPDRCAFLLRQSGYFCYVSCGYVHFGMGALCAIVGRPC